MMANKRGQAFRIELPPPENQGENQDESQADKDINESAEQFGSGSYILINRLDPATAQYAYLDRIPGTDIDQSTLSKRYGGGQYRLQYRGLDIKTKKMVQKRQAIMMVDASIPSKTPPGLNEIKRQAGQEDESDVKMDGILKTGVLRLFNGYENLLARRDNGESQGSNNEMLQLMMAQMSNSTQMMMAQMQAQAQAQAQTMQALIAMIANKPEAPSLMDQIAAYKAVGADKQPQPLKETLESMKLLREMATDVAPDDSWQGLVREFAPPVMNAITQARQEAQPVQQPIRPVPAIASNQPTDPHMLWKVAIKAHLPFLLKQARADKDPELYATLMYDQIPENYLGDLRGLASSSTFVTDTLAAFPETQPYRQWFSSLLSNIRAIALASDNENDDTDDLLEDTKVVDNGTTHADKAGEAPEQTAAG